MPAQTFTTLLNFNGTNGAQPWDISLVQGIDGNFYATTELGGANPNCDYYGSTYGCGTVFRITPEGALTTLYSFCSEPGCADGYGPIGALILATDGNFYGTTELGGANGNYGTVFKITPEGTLTTLHSFDGTDGALPGAVGLVQATDGNFYGTTTQGGTYGYATVFKITPAGAFTTLHNFSGIDGAYPYAGVIQGTDGNFYGTTNQGGTYNLGTVFKITPGGTLTTLHSFDDGTDGAWPAAALIQGADENFYGTTTGGNGAPGYGTFFKTTADGTLTTLFSFDDTDGNYPVAPVVQAAGGSFYGTTVFGGNMTCTFGCGMLFKITPAGTLTTLHEFDGTDGSGIVAGLMQATNGILGGNRHGRDSQRRLRSAWLWHGLQPLGRAWPLREDRTHVG